MDLSKIVKLPFPQEQYVRAQHDKTQIILHRKIRID